MGYHIAIMCEQKSRHIMKDKPHYIGHRDRLRKRFRAGGKSALGDYELLELVLFRAIPRRDVKQLAKKLIKTFGSFAEAISAPPARLREIDGVGVSVVTEFKIIQEAAIRLAQERVLNRPVLSSWNAVVDYCKASMAYSSKEQFRILFLDRKNALITDELQQEGTIDHTPVYPREVVKRALELSAASIIMVHNHPSGDPTPSRADVEMTKQIIDATRALKISVHDHLIIGKGGHASLKSLGLI